MRKLLFIVLLVVVAFNSYSQEIVFGKQKHLYKGSWTNDDFFSKSEFIFEGKVIDRVKCYLNDDSTKVYSSVSIEIREIYKGGDKINVGTVHMVMEGGIYYDDKTHYRMEYYCDNCIGFDRNPTIFFCVKSDFPEPKEKDFYSNYGISIKPVLNKEYACLRYNVDERLNYKFFGLKDLYFKTSEEFYNYIKKYKGITVPDPSLKKKLLRVLKP